MPLGKAMENFPGQFPKELEPNINEVITLNNKQYVLSEMQPSEANKLIDDWKKANYSDIKDTKGPWGWVANLVEPYCEKKGRWNFGFWHIS